MRAKTARKPRQARRVPDVLTREEAINLLRQTSKRAPTGIRNRAGLMLMYRGGLRVSEVANLTPQDVKLSNGQGPRLIVRQGKGRKDRTVPLPQETVDTLLLWEARREEFAPRSRWFFCTITEGTSTGIAPAKGKRKPLKPGSQVQPAYWRALVTRLARKASIGRRVHPHMLRHTFATEKLREGWDIESLRVMLGHSSVATTQVYLHVDETRLSELQAKAEPLKL